MDTLLRETQARAPIGLVSRLKGETIGARIREAYEAAGLNRHQLHLRTGLAYTTIDAWERGERVPEMASIIRVAEVTGFTPSDILGEQATAPESGTPSIEAAIVRRERDFGRPLSEGVKLRVRRYAAYGGDFSQRMAESLIDEAIAEEAGRAVARPDDADARVNDAAGQVAAKPRKRRSRAEE